MRRIRNRVYPQIITQCDKFFGSYWFSPVREVECGSSSQQIDLISLKSFKKVTIQPMIAFQVVDDWFDPGSSAKLFSGSFRGR